MIKNNKKLLSVILTAAIGASFVSVPTYAEAEEMIIKAPQYYRVENEHVLDPVDLKTDDFTVPVASGCDYSVTGENGQFVWPDSYSSKNCIQYAPVTGNFKTVVDIENGAGKDATLYVAVYDAEGKLVSANLDSKVKADATDTLEATIAVGENEIFKSFIWDGATMAPLEFQGNAPVVDRFFCDGDSTVSFAWENRGDTYTLYKNGKVVENPTLSKIAGDTSTESSSLWNLSCYTDTSAVADDYYEVAGSNGVKSKKYVANFDKKATIKLGLAFEGRNMMAVKNDEIAWWYDAVHRSLIVDGVECVSPNVKATYSNGAFRTSKYQLRVDPSIVTGEGNTVDVKIKYFDDLNPFYDEADPGSLTYRVIQTEYYQGGSKKEADIVSTTGTNTWKEATIRLENMKFNVGQTEGDWKRNTQFVIKGGTIAEVTVTPVRDFSIKDLQAEFVYSDGAYLTWDVATSKGVTGYTIKKDDIVIAQNVTAKEYFDKSLTAGQTALYTVTAETEYGAGEESDQLAVTALAAGNEYDDSEFAWAVNATGTGGEGELRLRSTEVYNDETQYDANILFSGNTTDAQPVGGESNYSYNSYYNTSTTWKQWRNCWFFDVPNEFLYGTDYQKLAVDVEYYALGETNFNLMFNSDAAKYSVTSVKDAWTTQTFDVVVNDGKNTTFSDCYSKAGGRADFKFMFEDCQGYIRKVTIRKVEESLDDAKVINLANTGDYKDAVVLTWDSEKDSCVTGYTIKRDDSVIAENLTAKTYTDKDLSADTTYSYEVIPEGGSELGKGSATLEVKTADATGESLKTEVYFEVNSDGTGYTGEMNLRRWNIWSAGGNYDRFICFSGETTFNEGNGTLPTKTAIGGKHYSYNYERSDFASGNAYQRWRNAWYFDVPNDFLTGNDFGTVEVEVEYYAESNNDGAVLNLNVYDISDSYKYTSGTLEEGAWSTVTFTVKDTDKGGIITFDDKDNNGTDGQMYNKYDPNMGPCNIRLLTTGGTDNAGCQLYIHKVTVRKVN